MTLMVFAIAVYLLLQLGVGYWASRRVRSEKDYLLAGRSLGLAMATLSLFATWFGAETVMGSSAAIAEEGLAGSRADPFGYTICLMLMALLLAYQLRTRELVTIGDLFRARYSRTVELLAVVIMIPTSIIWAAAQLLGFGLILSVVGDWDIQTALALATLLVITYTFMGGLLGDVVIDMVQGAIVIVGLCILLFFVLQKGGGLGDSLAMIRAEQLRFAAEGESWLSRLDTWMIPILGSLVSQEALARLLAARDAATARRACWLASGIYLVVGLIPVLIALVGTHIAPALEHRDQFIISLAQGLLPDVLLVIFVGALVSAILSTVDSTLLAVSSLVSHNILLPFMSRATEKQKVVMARISVVAAGLVAYYIATVGENIYALLEAASSFGTAGVLVVVLLGLWTRLGSPRAAVATLVVGITCTISGKYVYSWEAPFLASVGVSLVTFLAVSALERRLSSL